MTNSPAVVLISQAAYIDRCLTVFASAPWPSQYRQATQTQKLGMLHTFTGRLQSAAEAAKQRPQDVLQSIEQEEERSGFCPLLYSRKRDVYLKQQEVEAALTRKEVARRQVFDHTAYLLTDEHSELWMEFCVLKEVFTETLRQQLKVARKTLELLEDLCLEQGGKWLLKPAGDSLRSGVDGDAATSTGSWADVLCRR